MDEPVYSVAMDADSDTYIYQVFRYIDGELSVCELTLSEVFAILGRRENNMDALVVLSARASDVYAMAPDRFERI